LLEQRLVLAREAGNAEGTAADAITAKVAELDQKLDELRKKNGARLLTDHVDIAAIDQTASEIYNVPVDRLDPSAAADLLTLNERMQGTVKGQDHAVDVVTDAILRNRAGLADPNAPIGSFIFQGPTGVGKTEIARTLARELMGSDKNMIRFDMGEFAEAHQFARLVGSPAGYVGHSDGGGLTEALRKNPNSVILLDEIEKAHPQIFQRLLALLEEGRITDGQNRTADARNAVFIMTTNLKDEKGEHTFEAVKNFFSPEFLNRIDEVVQFNPLGKAEIDGILVNKLKPLTDRADAAGLGLVIDDSAKAFLAEQGFSPEHGARELNRVIEREVENPAAKELLKVRAKGEITKLAPGQSIGELHMTHNPGDEHLSFDFIAPGESPPIKIKPKKTAA
jgi:ATP-dependent Clp protease ATP-binding subunit ClpB